MHWKIPLKMDKEYAELQWIKKQRDQLREALEKIESMDESLVYDMRGIAGAALRATEEP